MSTTTEMEFLKGGGKTFEFVRIIANLVLARGGTEEHMLKILRPHGLVLASEVADLLVGRSVSVGRPLKDIVLDNAVPKKSRADALMTICDPSLALRILKDSDESESVLTRQAVFSIVGMGDLARRDELLREVALLPRRHDAKFALSFMRKQEHILEVVLKAVYQETCLAAVKKLDEERLTLAARCTESEVRFLVATLARDPDTLRFLAEEDEVNTPAIRAQARERMETFGLIVRHRLKV
ncbi:MAG: hypothetical protein A2664_01740 [Candidatus Taylorbacteria bacterium RIFCSPHIGHO2_01_FULL_46_22b]|uniref:Uncharacterized protein n=1 Tax=Candidatus Taylorbacteria bacterium RIFCSPHIGHO2_01_FULL_46_22b TaxID=1802301 RepID=A0A1G2M537_9BACT|nr:MAG: hypothetical protein A2664_01740 [Candidatus Taylorbacteria bacterium RIFCSPHIGHO2_01_FULL_46_22b]